MIKIMQSVFDTWRQYWGASWYPWLLAAGAAYLLLFKRKDEKIRQLLLFSGILLAVFAFPPTAWILQKCVGQEVYWRVLWVLPTIPLLACAGTELAFSLGKRKILQGIILLSIAGAFAFGGKSVWQAGNYEKVNNYQKVPDEVAQICQQVKDLGQGKKICLAANDHLAAYIRVYDPSIYMPYSRGAKGAARRAAKRLYQEMESPQPDIRQIIKASKRLEVNYLVHTPFTAKQEKKLKKHGFLPAGMVNEYRIYAKTK